MYGTRVLVLFPLLVGLAHCFSWDVVVGDDQYLKFYYYGTVTHSEHNPLYKKIKSVIYDPVDFRVMFADEYAYNVAISSYDLTTGKIKTLVEEKFRNFNGNVYLAYEPLKKILFWSAGNELKSISLKPTASNTTAQVKVIHRLPMSDVFGAIAVDSCGGYIYWIVEHTIERAAFNGSERQVVVRDNIFKNSFAIDQLTQTMFWIHVIENDAHSIESADLNGKNRRTFYIVGKEVLAVSLAVSKDYIYWQSYKKKPSILRLPKHHEYDVEPTVYANLSEGHQYYSLTAANYTIEEQTCEALKSSLEKNLQCYGSPCFNYCVNGNCSVGAEGLPNCSCEAGYAGKRCEVNECYKHCLHGGDCSMNEEDEPVCQCTAGYEGERCDVATSATVVQAEHTKQEIGQNLRGEVTLKSALLIFSDKKYEYEANITIREKSIEDHDR